MLLRALLLLRQPTCGGRRGLLAGGHACCCWTLGRHSLVASVRSLAGVPSAEPRSSAFLAVSGQRKTKPPPAAAASSLHATAAAASAAGRRSGSSLASRWKDATSIRHGPAPALLLGLAGLAPFALAPGCMLAWGCYDGQLVASQTIYAATVLAFLGGVRWGAALPDCSPVKADWFNLTTSVLPPLLAWAALLLPQPWPLPAVLGALLGVLYADLRLLEYPAWFRGLRLLLSGAAAASLALSIVCWLALSEKQDRKPSASLSLLAPASGAPEVVAQADREASPKAA